MMIDDAAAAAGRRKRVCGRHVFIIGLIEKPSLLFRPLFRGVEYAEL